MPLKILPDKILCLIFSKDRPLQLDATLRSLYDCCVDIESLDIHILYKSYDLEIVDSYKDLKSHFKNCLFIQEYFFQNQVHALLIKYKWILFLVDDNIFFKKVLYCSNY